MPFSAARSPAKPGAGRGPRIAASSCRAASRNASGASPPAASGCFSAASSGTGASALSARSRTRRRNTPGGVRSSGRPAESSMSMSQRRNSAATRRASSRSGVTSAAVAPGVSRLRRSSSAIADRLVLRAGAVVAREAGQCRFRFRRQIAPRIGQSPPAAAPRRQTKAPFAPARRRRSAARPVAHILGCDIERLQQQRHQVLRVRRLGGDQLPRPLVARAVEAGQDDATLVEPGDRREQIDQRRDAAGQPGGDHRRSRRRRAAIAPPGAAARGCAARPGRGRPRPSASPASAFGRISRKLSTVCQCVGVFARAPARRARRSSRPSALRLMSSSRASAAASAAAWPGSSGPLAAALAPVQHQPGQQQPAAQLGDRRRDREAGIVAAVRDRRARARSRRRRDRRSAAAAAAAAARRDRRPRRSAAGTPRATRAPRGGSAAARSSAAARAGRRRPAPAAPRASVVEKRPVRRDRVDRGGICAPTLLPLDAVRGEARARSRPSRPACRHGTTRRHARCACRRPAASARS